jgi:hypothetical protein
MDANGDVWGLVNETATTAPPAGQGDLICYAPEG